MPAKSSRRSGTSTRPRATRCSTVSALERLAAGSARRPARAAVPMIAPSSVVLPAPLGPMTVTMLPLVDRAARRRARPRPCRRRPTDPRPRGAARSWRRGGVRPRRRRGTPRAPSGWPGSPRAGPRPASRRSPSRPAGRSAPITKSMSCSTSRIVMPSARSARSSSRSSCFSRKRRPAAGSSSSSSVGAASERARDLDDALLAQRRGCRRRRSMCARQPDALDGARRLGARRAPPRRDRASAPRAARRCVPRR